MTKLIERVHTDAATIDRLKALQQELDAELEVELHLTDGRVLRGTVVERPSLLQFVDHGGQEGTNGSLRLDLADGSTRLLLLDEVAHVVRLGTA